jgi:hypothetical protein
MVALAVAALMAIQTPVAQETLHLHHHRKAVMAAAEVHLRQITAQVVAAALPLLVAMDQVAPLVMVALAQHRQFLVVP